jgi:DNA-binding NtrC family response regulator
MKNFSSVLVLTNNEQSDLVNTLFDVGYVPLIREKMTSVLKDIHHKCVAVIILDLQCIEIDALEFVINVRDIDQHLPVVIVNGKNIEGKKQILNQHNIFFISNVYDQIKKFLNEVA